MTISTNGQICFGVILDEDNELPWDAEDFDGDIDYWWTFAVLGLKRSFEMFTPDGDWIGGKEWPKDKSDQYYQERRDFEENNPKLPVELINYCSDEYPMYILAISETCYGARRGYPEKIIPVDLSVTNEQIAQLFDFCKTYGVKFEGEPAWYLSSYWG